MKKQRCPVCKQNLPQEAYQPACWGKKGEACRTCKRARQRKWIANNPDRVRERYRTWKEKQPPTYERDRKLLRKYGITRTIFEQMLSRQLYKCLGCQTRLTLSAHVDHDHTTGKVRGLLCNNCNTTLGMVKEDKTTLRRLMAYLDYDRTQIHIYLIGALKNPRVPEIAQQLRSRGYEVMDEWHGAGPEADDLWMAYEQNRGRTYTEALKGRAAQNIFHFDLVHIDLADCVVLVLPAGKSSHLELGYALGNGKTGFILLDEEPSRYEVMPNFAKAVCVDFDELLGRLKDEFTAEKFLCGKS